MQSKDAQPRELIDRTLRDALSGDAVLFIGAGMSYQCSNASGTMPNGKKLAEIISTDFYDKTSEKISLEKNPPLSRIAQFYKKKIGPNSLQKLLQEKLKCTNADNRYKNIVNMPWRRIYTTNFDDALEHIRPTSQTFSHTSKANNVKKGAIIHLNGSINDTISGDNEDIILSDWSYTARDLRGSPWGATFRRDLATARSIIFLGFSLTSDLDIARILASESTLKEKTIFFVGPDTDPLDKSTIEDFGTVFVEGFDLFYARFRQVKKTFDPQLRVKQFTALQELKLSTDREKLPSLEERQAFLLFGDAPDAIILSSDDDIHQEFVFPRNASRRLSSDIINGIRKDALIIGGMASGKSVSIIQVARSLLKAGKRVFFAKSRRRLLEEIDDIITLEGDVVVLFDDYVDYFEALEKLVETRGENINIIVSCNSRLHEAVEKRFDKLDLITSTYTVDTLERDEVPLLNNHLTRSALWKHHSGLSETRRNSIIYNELKSSLSLVLLDVVDSKIARTAFEVQTKPILEDKSAASFFTCLLISISLEFKLDAYDWDSMFGVHELSTLKDKYKPQLNHFFSRSSGNTLEPSRLAGAYILRRLVESGLIIDSAMDLFNHFRNRYGDEFGARHYQVELMKYSRIEPLFRIESFDKSTGRNEFYPGMYKIFSEYYDELGRLGTNDNNPEYWLQYGIALAVNADLSEKKQLSKVESIFDTGKRKASSDGKSSRNLDNFYARFQLLKAGAVIDSNEAFNLFVTATTSLSKKMMLDSESVYPYKVGRAFVDIAASHFDQWENAKQKVFLSRAEWMLSNGKEYERKHGTERNISLMISELDQMLSTLSRKSE